MTTPTGPEPEPVDGRTRNGIQSRYGDRWLARLPDIVRRETARLGRDVVRLLPGGRTACVVVTTRHGGDACVLKLAPDLARSRAEAAALERLTAAGIAPRTREVWEDDHTGVPYHGMLTTLAGDGSSLRDRPQTTPPPAAFTHLLTALDACGREPLTEPLEPVTDHVRRGLQRGLGGGWRGTPPPTADDLSRATHMLTGLSHGLDDRWVHGSLHPANLVLDHRGHLLVIDPRPFRSDAAYDVAEVALKVGSERDGRNHNIPDGLRMLEQLSTGTGVDHERAAQWLRVLAISGV